MKKTITLLMLIIGIMNESYATDVSTTNKATATLASTCSISANNVDFGDITEHSPTNGSVVIVKNSPITVLCSNNVAYNIYQGLGAWGDQTVGRRLKGVLKGDTWGYWLCKTSAFTGNQCGAGATWFNGDHISGIGTGVTQIIPMYLITYTYYWTPDSYADTTTTTLIF